MLTYVATDLHDTYLPLYQREVLGMSSTSVSLRGVPVCC